jgi:hypothetical protein
MDNSEAIRSIENIVAVAVSDIKKPYPSNIIDLIFGKIESNDNLLKDYELLIATSSARGVNARIGKEIKKQTMMNNSGKSGKSKCKIIKTYTFLS